MTLVLAGFLIAGCLSAEAPISQSDNASALYQFGNGRPSIDGNPSLAVLHGELYEFEPQASDPDGDPLRFEIANRPYWAAFDAATGRLHGQPVLQNVGTYEDIVISVTDGEVSESMRAFSVTVSQTALGAVELSWLAPSQNSDGTALLDLAGYRIYFGKSSQSFDHEIHINDPGITTYVVDNLVPDTYFFSATSVNASGAESNFAAEEVRTIK